MRACLFTFHTYRYLHLLQNYGFSKVAKPEAVAQRCSVKKVFLEISQNSQENTCVSVSFLIKLHLRPVILLKKRFGGWF